MNKIFLENIFSKARMEPYFSAYLGDEYKSITHYQCNIELSEALYPCVCILEVSLRNSINRAMEKKFACQDWYNYFPTTLGLTSLTGEINKAKNHIIKRKELVIPSKVIAELTLGFWVRLFNAEYEMTLWKELRLTFPHLSKRNRKRHYVSAPLNSIRILRNRIFHHEPVCWNLNRIQLMHDEIITVMGWINDDIPKWIHPIDRFDEVFKRVKLRLR